MRCLVSRILPCSQDGTPDFLSSGQQISTFMALEDWRWKSNEHFLHLRIIFFSLAAYNSSSFYHYSCSSLLVLSFKARNLLRRLVCRLLRVRDVTLGGRVVGPYGAGAMLVG